jgi:hypothetical protein
MLKSKFFLPAAVCGFSGGVLFIVPVIKGFSFFLIVPLAAIFSISLFARANSIRKNIRYPQALILGALSGFFAALVGSCLDVLITLITRSNDFLTNYSELMEASKIFPPELQKEMSGILKLIADQIQYNGFSPMYTFIIFFDNIIFDLIFGLIGGLIGMRIFNNRLKKSDVMGN